MINQNVAPYAEWCKAKIVEICADSGISVAVTDVNQGPLHLTFSVFIQDLAQSLAKFEKLKDLLMMELGVDSIRFQRNKRLYDIQIPSPDPMTPTGKELALATMERVENEDNRTLEIAVGLNEKSEPMFINPRANGAILWIGPSRRGKTQSMRSTLLGLLYAYRERVRFCVICQPAPRKIEDWSELDKCIASLGLITDPDEYAPTVAWFAEQAVSKTNDLIYILIIDDLSAVATPEMDQHLKKIATVGAGTGVHLWAGTHSAGKDATGSTFVDKNASTRIVYKPTNKAQGSRDSGQPGLDLDQLSGTPGDALLVVDGFAERIATGWFDDRTLSKMTRGRTKNYRKWLRPSFTPLAPNRGVGVGVDTGVGAGVHVQSAVFLEKNEDFDESDDQGGYEGVRGVNGVKIEFFENLRLPASANLNEQEKLQLYGAYQYFGSNKKLTARRVLGGDGGNQKRILSDAIAFAEARQPQPAPTPAPAQTQSRQAQFVNYG